MSPLRCRSSRLPTSSPKRSRSLDRLSHKLSLGLLLGLSLGLSFVGCERTSTAPSTQRPSTQRPSTQRPSTQRPSTQRSLSLKELPLSDVKTSGHALMSLPLGLHTLSRGARPSSQPTTHHALLVHGFGSEGYEWVYAAHELSALAEVSFWRWDWLLCPNEAAPALRRALEALAAQDPSTPLLVLAHSYGGVILTHALADYQGRAPVSAHVIASPLAGHPQLEARCGSTFTPLKRPPPQVNLTQWKTQQALDTAFKDLPNDPQASELPTLSLTLPSLYRGRRLGHNWSISAVVDQLTRCAPHLTPSSDAQSEAEALKRCLSASYDQGLK